MMGMESSSYLLLICLVSHLFPAVLPDTNPKSIDLLPRLERDFTQRLYQRISLGSSGGSLVVSPLSVHVLLFALLEGATGQTRSQLTTMLGLKQLTDLQYNHLRNDYKTMFESKGNAIQMVNTVFMDKGFIMNKDYKSMLKEYYHIEIETLDFENRLETIKSINRFVMQHTNNTIRQILTEGDILESSTMICISTVHLRDSWALPFPKSTTTTQPFHSTLDKETSVNMMYMTNQLHFFWDRTLKAKILALELNTKGLSLVLMLPDMIDGLPDLEASLANIDYISFLRLVQSTPPVSVEVWLPTFRVQGQIDLEHILQQMGLTSLFAPTADLTGISCCGGLHVSKIKHKTYIVIGENGIEASSTTAVDINNGVNKNISQEFRADHPFMFFLLTDDLVIFQGRFLQP